MFDRVRENVPRMPQRGVLADRQPLDERGLARSLATSFCTALPILALLLFGGETLKDFAFALLVGTLSGAYSSIFIASPVLTHWKEREPVYAPPARIAEQFGGIVPAYAVATAGAPVDVAPDASAAPRARSPRPRIRRRASRGRSSTRWCATSASSERSAAQATAAAAGRPQGGRRARARADVRTTSRRRRRARPR